MDYWNRLGPIRSTRNQLLEYLENRLTYKITKFYRDIHTDIVYSHTGYDAIVYFRSKVIAKKLSKIPLRQLRVEFLGNGLARTTKFYTLVKGNRSYKPAGMTSLPSSGRLQNVVKYCTEVRKTGR